MSLDCEPQTLCQHKQSHNKQWISNVLNRDITGIQISFHLLLSFIWALKTDVFHPSLWAYL